MKTSLLNITTIVCMLLTPFLVANSAALEPAKNNLRDQSVLNVVLLDLMTYSGDDYPANAKKIPPNEIYFRPNANNRPQTINDVLRRTDEKKWKQLTTQQHKLSKEAAQNLVARTNTGDFFTDFKAKDKRIHLYPKQKKVDFLDPDRKRPFQAWTPGYSKDGTLALVRLTFSWSIHGAESTYILLKEDKKWKVILRQFTYYV